MTNLYEEIYKLKRLLRKGWMQHEFIGADRCESVAEHIFSSCVLALEIINKDKLNLDTEKVLKMLLYHEMGEIIIGDITPYDNVTIAQKYEMEKKAVETLSKKTDTPEMLDLWLEFESNATKESIFVKKVDKLDAILQAEIYSKEKNNVEIVKEFYTTSIDKVKGLEKYISYTPKDFM